MPVTKSDVVAYARQIDPRIQQVEIDTDFDGEVEIIKLDISVAWASLDTFHLRKILMDAWVNQIKQGCVPLGCVVKCRYRDVFF